MARLKISAARRRSRVVSFRLTIEEHERLKAAARAMKRHPNALARELVCAAGGGVIQVTA